MSNELCSIVATDECAIYVWKGVPADPTTQRAMWPWYHHCGSIGELKHKDKALYDIRMKVIKRWFSAKDSNYANIYRHYDNIEQYW